MQPICPVNPCLPSPCGPNSICRIVNNHAVCSCQPSCVGSPPTCRPECMVSSDCPQNRACINQKCQDPCPGTCGFNAICQVVNHNPVCCCAPGFTGDPFTRCLIQQRKLLLFYSFSPSPFTLFFILSQFYAHLKRITRKYSWWIFHVVVVKCCVFNKWNLCTSLQEQYNDHCFTQWLSGSDIGIWYAWFWH